MTPYTKEDYQKFHDQLRKVESTVPLSWYHKRQLNKRAEELRFRLAWTRYYDRKKLEDMDITLDKIKESIATTKSETEQLVKDMKDMKERNEL